MPKRQRAPRARRNGRAASAPARSTEVAIQGIRRLARGLRLAARDVERATGLSAAQIFVLEQLERSDAPSIAHLAARTLTDRSSVSAIVDRLAARGLVTVSSAQGDRRRAEVRITTAGCAVLRRAPHAPGDLMLAALGRMPSADVRALGALLAALNAEMGFEDAGLLFADKED